MTPIDRACLEYAIRVVFAFDHVFILPDGQFVLHPAEIGKIKPSRHPSDAVAATLAQMMKFHLGGSSFAELRDDLLRSGVGEQFANSVHDHLVDVSADEWAGLRARVRWYAQDTVAADQPSTEVEGDT